MCAINSRVCRIGIVALLVGCDTIGPPGDGAPCVDDADCSAPLVCRHTAVADDCDDRCGPPAEEGELCVSRFFEDDPCPLRITCAAGLLCASSFDQEGSESGTCEAATGRANGDTCGEDAQCASGVCGAFVDRCVDDECTLGEACAADTGRCGIADGDYVCAVPTPEDGLCALRECDDFNGCLTLTIAPCDDGLECGDVVASDELTGSLEAHCAPPAGEGSACALPVDTTHIDGDDGCVEGQTCDVGTRTCTP